MSQQPASAKQVQNLTVDSHGAESRADLHREAASMLELLTRQSAGSTPLQIFSKAAQAVLRQF